jgi:hypothetical protein
MFQKQTVLGFPNLYQFVQRDEVPSWYCRVRIVHFDFVRRGQSDTEGMFQKRLLQMSHYRVLQ